VYTAVSHELDNVAEEDAREFLARCCGAARWVDRMLARRPFGSEARLLSIAGEEWFALTPEDWREAFSHHPRIGDRTALAARFPRTADLSSAEQRGVEGASQLTIDQLAHMNRAYEEKFGYIFIVCAAGKSAEEMLQLLEKRLHNDPRTELRVAAQEQARITALRLRGYRRAANTTPCDEPTTDTKNMKDTTGTRGTEHDD
jgi:2-oxo-4-hydroxy-4-carboxy-5-ureidoimidazoline decarboxylase